jgi:hypothetical protein
VKALSSSHRTAKKKKRRRKRRRSFLQMETAIFPKCKLLNKIFWALKKTERKKEKKYISPTKTNIGLG